MFPILSLVYELNVVTDDESDYVRWRHNWQ